jgi:hypothetical protein
MRYFPAFFLVPFLFLVSPLISMDWPSPSGLMTKNFGWNDGGLPHLGLSFDDEGDVAAAGDGELLFYRSDGDTASRLPSPLGSWVAMDHGDGIISVYSRFETKPPASMASAASIPAAIPNRIERGGFLGESGISGWSSRRGFYFQLFDRKERRWINPSMIVARPENTRPPTILQVRLRDSAGRLFDPSQTRNLSQGRYVVLANAITGTPNAPLAPYRIICSLNGSEAGVLGFETYSARNGALMVFRNGLVPVRRVYAPVPGYEIADLLLTRGQITLEIIAQDIDGNTRNVVYRLTIE